MADLKISGDAPVYPADARAQGISGAVVMHAIIAKNGTVENLSVVSGNAVLAEAALNAVKTWVYKPYLLNDEPTEVDTIVTVNFKPEPQVSPNGAPGNDLPIEILKPIKMLKPMPGSSPPAAASPVSAALLSRVAPVYPAVAKAARVEGDVVVSAIITRDGHVRDAEAIRGPELLRPAAVDAVRQWVFQPPQRNGMAAEALTEVTLHFGLDSASPGHAISRQGGPGMPETVSGSPSVAPSRTARLSSGVVAGLKTGGSAPVYPVIAMAARIGGVVVLHAFIGKDGHVKDLTVLSGPPLLAPAAIDAVKTWTYRPFLLQGEPTDVDTTITVNFNVPPQQTGRPSPYPAPVGPR